MNFAEEEPSKRYCIRGKHAAIICGVVVAVGLIVGLSVGLTRSCDSSGDTGQDTTTAPTQASSTTSTPPLDQDICPAREDEIGEWTNFRLPDFITPVHYDLEVKPFMDEDRYTGTVTISISLSKPTHSLWLHIRETKITKLPELVTPSGKKVSIQRCFEYKQQEYVVVQAEEELAATSGDSVYLLTMEFAGWLNGSLVGFYRTTYTENGQVKSIAATDHEPTDARKSFPCFDEPNKKATYNISIIHRKEYSALSNMPVLREETVDNNWNRTVFMKSVPMSTYLVCFAVHQFTRIERTSNSGKPLNIYVQPEQAQTAEYAANVTKIVFDYFEEYFAMSYSLPKLDKIAIPDFGTGAMENWGLITYRETNLLFDPNESASSNKQRVASVIAHELVHQLSQVLIEDVLPVQEEDSLMSSHPVVVTVSTPAEITSVFDGISYSKGASILRMLEDWITPEKFQKGCQASSLPVKEVMETWTNQMGYPVVTVSERQKLKQARFLLDSKADPFQPPSPLSYRWNIPIKWTENNKSNVTVFNISTEEITLNPSLGAEDFLKINPDHIGFYRVNYEEVTWDKIAENLSSNHSSFSAADRASFIDDAFALARAKHLDYGNALNLTQYLRSEEDFLPWQRAISAVTYIISMFEDDTELYPMIETYFQSQVKPIADSLGWNDAGSHIQKLLRASVLGFACKMGDKDALAKASELFEDWVQGGKSIPVNLRLLVYRYGMQNSGNERLWNYTLEQYQKTSLAQEKEKLLYGLASVKDVTLLARYLEMFKDPDIIKTQDVFTVIRYISYNTYGKSMAWNWIQLNWDYLVDRFTINDRYLGRIVTIAEPFNTELQLWQMQSFFAKYPNAGAGAQPREQVLETVKNNIEWVKENRDSISQWFKNVLKDG
ncbi:Glutamyl aminopeptidase [Microtus ochrogaster]|uniref:Aminopeptidase n=1 Tax=Microtus ochrogaster TaxID=79684 RepID=A0A8J6FZC8_MICOH|nr:Glutamyl aminopeptidase [Microtus ochrogaster]